MTMPNPLPPETTPEWTERLERALHDAAKVESFYAPEFLSPFAREILRLREAQDAEIAKLRSRELVAEVIVSFIEDTLSGGNDLAFRHTMDHNGQRSQSNDEDGTIVWINAPIGDPDRSGSLDGESFTDAMADYIRRSGTPEVVAELNAGLRSELSRSRSVPDEDGVHAAKVMMMYGKHMPSCEVTRLGERGVCTCGFLVAIQAVRALAARSRSGEETRDALTLPPARKRTFLGALDWAIGIIAQRYASRTNGMDDLDRVREWIESIPTPDACRAANVELRAEKENTCPQCAKPIIVDLAAWMYESDEELEDICQCPASASETVA